MDETYAAHTDQLVERLFGAALGALELMSIHVGWRLGLYAELAGGGALRPADLAERVGIDGRYAREWLEQQATAGLLNVDDVSLDAEERRYQLPKEHAGVLVDAESAAHVAPFAPMIVGIAGVLPEVIDAYRSGAGVPYTRYGADFRDGQGAINRPAFHHELAGWIAAMPDVDERLRSDASARIVDVGCGQGWSTIALARAYPRAEVVGVDSDTASVADASERALGAGVDVSFRTIDAGMLDGSADLVCIFEALHDMAGPVEALSAARRTLKPGGVVLVADERVADSYVAPGDEIERMMYAWSVLHCLPASRAESPSAALGTVLRAETVERLALDAGFASVEVLGIENDFFRFYRLEPAAP